jgi:hypothetical protein
MRERVISELAGLSQIHQQNFRLPVLEAWSKEAIARPRTGDIARRIGLRFFHTRPFESKAGLAMEFPFLLVFSNFNG